MTAWSVFVVMIAVLGMPAPVVNVVDMIAVRNCNMTAAVAVSVVMPLMYCVAAVGVALVIVIVVAPVKMTVMRVVNVVTMWHCHMSAAVPMGMGVIDVFVVGGCHCSSWQLIESPFTRLMIGGMFQRGKGI